VILVRSRSLATQVLAVPGLGLAPDYGRVGARQCELHGWPGIS